MMVVFVSEENSTYYLVKILNCELPGIICVCLLRMYQPQVILMLSPHYRSTSGGYKRRASYRWNALKPSYTSQAPVWLQKKSACLQTMVTV